MVDVIDDRGESPISIGDSPDVMADQGDIDAVVGIRPVRMMIGSFGLLGHPRHEPPCRREVDEFEISVQSPLVLVPPGRRLDFFPDGCHVLIEPP